MNIINYKELELPIVAIEKVLEHYDMEEQALILKLITNRYQKKVQQQMMREGALSINVPEMIKAFRKQAEGGEE